MTIDQFFEALATKRDLPWRVSHGMIRAPIGDIWASPITALPDDPQHHTRTQEVAASVGLSEADMWAIVAAEDCADFHDPALRARLLATLGLEP